ncbi:hypothetical protein BCR44DRAFT_77132, partial [Catenaria anguillulae PL171]
MTLNLSAFNPHLAILALAFLPFVVTFVYDTHTLLRAHPTVVFALSICLNVGFLIQHRSSSLLKTLAARFARLAPIFALFSNVMHTVDQPKTVIQRENEESKPLPTNTTTTTNTAHFISSNKTCARTTTTTTASVHPVKSVMPSRADTNA